MANVDEAGIAAGLEPVDDDDVYDSWELDDSDESDESDHDGVDEYLEQGDSDSEIPLPHRESGNPATALGNPYVYEPLASFEDKTPICIIHLAPAINFNENLWCKLSTTAVRVVRQDAKAALPSKEYAALSYTWGSRQNPEYLFILPKTRSQETYLEITQNLHEALKYLRDPTKEIVLWVDAICINQEDLAERNSQLYAMAQIYQVANVVYAWMGPESDINDGRFCLELIENVVLLNHSSPPRYGVDYLLQQRSHDKVSFDSTTLKAYHAWMPSSSAPSSNADGRYKSGISRDSNWCFAVERQRHACHHMRMHGFSAYFYLWHGVTASHRR